MYPLLAGASLVLLLGRFWQLARWSGRRGDAEAQPGRIDWRSGVVVFLVLLAWRWPFLLDPNQFNPDESQLIAGAITVEHKPDFWRSLDGTTSGPLNALGLLPTHWLGVPQDYFNARLTGLLLMWVAWAASFGLLRRWVGAVVAFTALLPAVVFLGVVTEGDILHYSSEHLSVALSCVGVWLLAVAGDRKFRGWSWWWGGFVIGLLPWAKLQAGPLAAMLSAWACGWVILGLAESGRAQLIRCGVLAVAVLTPTIFLVGLYVIAGQGAHFLASYVESNVGYTQQHRVGIGIKLMIHHAKQTGSIPIFLGIQLGLLVVGGLVALKQRMRPGLGFTLGIVATATAFIIVILPGRGFLHYFLFLVFPISWWSGAAMRSLGDRGGRSTNRVRALVGVAFVAVALQVGGRLLQPGPDMFGRFAWSWQQPRSEVAEVVRMLKEPGDSLAVWGWASDLHVQTGLPQATREAHTQRQVEAGPQRDSYYRPRYLMDLMEDRPAFFIDSVGHGAWHYFLRGDAGHETFPQLAEYLGENYVLVADFHRERLYLRKDRMADKAKIVAAFARAAAKWVDDPWNGDAAPEFSFTELRPLRMVEGLQVAMMEPPERIFWPLIGTERLMVLEFGHDPKSYALSGRGNGTLFSVAVEHPNGEAELRWSRHLNPAEKVEDRGRQKAKIRLPPMEPGSRLIIKTDPGPKGGNGMDRAYVARMGFRYRPDLKFLDAD